MSTDEPQRGRGRTHRKPTKTQLALLRLIEVGQVTFHHHRQGRMIATASNDRTGRDYMPRVDRLWDRGWVTSEERPSSRWTYIVLTDAGREALESARRHDFTQRTDEDRCGTCGLPVAASLHAQPKAEASKHTRSEVS